MRGLDPRIHQENRMAAGVSVGEREKADRRKAMPFGYPLFAVSFLAFNYILTYIADRSGNGYLMAISFCLFLLYFPMVIAYLAIFAVQAVKLKIRSAASTLAGIIVLSGYWFLGPTLAKAVFVPLDSLRLQMNSSRYQEIIDQRKSQVAGPALIFFDWGSSGFAANNLFFALVYDESREIELPQAGRSDIWKNKAFNQYSIINAEGCRSESTHLSGHFYSVTTAC
jgi:hypothetical protein